MPLEEKPLYYFICLDGENRSYNASRVFQEMAKERGLEVKTGSAGIALNSERPIDPVLLKKAKKIVVMKPYMKKSLVRVYEVFPENIVCLNVQDGYENNPDLLKQILRDNLEMADRLEGLF